MISEPSRSRLIAVVRWVGIVPAAVISNVFFDSVFMHIARWNIGHIWFISDPEPFVPLFSSGAGALAGVLAGAAVAPSFRGIVGLAVLVLQSIVASLVIGPVMGGVIPGEGLLPLGLSFLGSLVGSAVGFAVVIQKFGWRGPPPVMGTVVSLDRK